MQIPILSGIYTDQAAQFRTAYPRNLIPVPKQSGLSEGFLRHTDGIVKQGDAVGVDRGGINWNGVLYRVVGTKLVSISEAGVITTIGDIGGSGQVSLDYSFDHLAIASSGQLWLYNGTTLAQNTDADLGTVLDFSWIDGYFATTDGNYIVVTELNNPFAVNPLKYGSSEASPDPIIAIQKVRTELAALNRYTIEFFENVGGDYFPFQRIEGAQINKGVIGTHACTVVNDLIAFVGSGFNEQHSVYLGINGQVTKIATSEIDQQLATYTEAQLSAIVLEHKIYNGHIHIMIHLPDKTVVYDMSASQATGQAIWYSLDSGIASPSQYRAKNHVYAYNRWNVGDPTSTAYGYLTDTISSHYGSLVTWEFNTQVLYNEGYGATISQLELIGTTGRNTTNTTISTQYSLDGVTWSQEHNISTGGTGNRTKRLVWFMQGFMRNWRIQRFKGTSDAMISVARLEAKIEPLYV